MYERFVDSLDEFDGGINGEGRHVARTVVGLGQWSMPKGDRDRAQRAVFRFLESNVPAAVQRWRKLSHRRGWCRDCQRPER